VLGFFTIFPFPIHPKVPLCIALTIGLVVAFLPPPPRRRTTKDVITAIALYGAFLGGVSRIEGSPISRFKNTYSSIRVGMTIDEVVALVHREFPAVQPSIVRYEGGVLLCLDPVDHFYNAEIINISTKNGLVTSIDYLPD
jgi:hypothetical protein